jgi:hypothetical protein
VAASEFNAYLDILAAPEAGAAFAISGQPVPPAPDKSKITATSELRLGDDFPDGWDVTEVPVNGPSAVIMFDY